MPQAGGGIRKALLEEITETAGAFILLGLVLTSVYVSRIPKPTLRYFQTTLGQVLGLGIVLFITATYGWTHGILAALAYSLVVSRALRRGGDVESFLNIQEYPAVILPESQDTILVPKNHKWFIEKVLGENPYLIRDKEVTTSAVQDLSERGMGSNSASFSR
jgi:hypothetical protein